MSSNNSVTITRCPVEHGLRWLGLALQRMIKFPDWWLLQSTLLLYGFLIFAILLVVGLSLFFFYGFGLLLFILAPIMPSEVWSIFSEESIGFFFAGAAHFVICVFMPFPMAGIVTGDRVQASGKEPIYSVVFAGFRGRLLTLLGIGFVSFIVSIVFDIIFLPVLIKIGIIGYLGFVVASHSLLFFVFLLVVPIAMFQPTGVFQSITNSVKGLLINLPAFLVFFLTAISSISIILVPLIANFGVAFIWLIFLFVPFFLCWIGLAGFIAYCDIFHGGDALDNATAQESTS